MKIVTAIDSMKGSMTSIEANNIIEKVFADENTEVKKIAIADGGEGTLAAFLENYKGKLEQIPAHDLSGNELTASYVWIASEKLAVIESADTAGIQFLTEESTTHPSNTNTFGVGETILAALHKGAKKVIVGLGGTGTVDGGIGAMAALGVIFIDSDGQHLEPIGKNIGKVAEISYAGVSPLINGVEFLLATDVNSYLTGDSGAVKMFGKQKGIHVNEQDSYEAMMSHYEKILLRSSGKGKVAGDGAAGGLGIGLRVLLNAEVLSGFKIISEYSGLTKELENADLVITGEGKMDAQSLQGKVPVGISMLAKQRSTPVVAFVGMFDGDLSLFKEAGIDVVVSIISKITTLETALSQAHSNLEKAAITVKNLLFLLGRKSK